MRVSVRLLAQTNALDGAPISLFEVSNASPFAVLVGQVTFVEFDSPQMSPVPLAGGRYRVLRSGESHEDEIQGFTNDDKVRWRLRVNCARTEGGLWTYLRDLTVPTDLRSPPTFLHFSSDWVVPPPRSLQPQPPN